MTDGQSVAAPGATAAAADGSASTRLAAWAERVRQREIETATARLGSTDHPPDPAVRAALNDLSRALVERVLGDAVRTVAEAEQAGDRATVERALDLFELAEHPDDGESPSAESGSADGGIPMAARSD